MAENKSYPWEFRAIENMWLNIVDIFILIIKDIYLFIETFVMIPLGLSGSLLGLERLITGWINDLGNWFAKYIHYIDGLYVQILNCLPCGKPPVYK